MGKAELPLHAPGTQLDKGYIGQSVPRANAQRLLQGRGASPTICASSPCACCLLRSPYAHAKITKLDFKKALRAAGVIAVVDGRAVAGTNLGSLCSPT